MSLQLDNCDGTVDAWFEGRTVAVCYEYLQVVARRIENKALPSWVTPDEALAGAFVDAILHEFGHALFEQHSIPLLGREEDAADQFAAYTMLHLGGADAAGLIRGTAHVYKSWMDYLQNRHARKLKSGASSREARAHPTAAQRFYNLVCIALGSDRKAYAPLARAADLPEERSGECQDEYVQVALAYRQLIAPHIIRSRESAARQELRFFMEKR